MRISARNQLTARVVSISRGAGLREGSEATALVKASDVLLAVLD